MVRDDDLATNNWKLGKVVAMHLVCKVRVLVYDGTKPSHLDRPIQKPVLIVGQEDGEKENLDIADADRVNRGDFGRRCAKIVRARRLFPANFAFRCFANNNFKDVKFSAL